MAYNKGDLKTLTDEQIISEFVKRFECDAAVLIYFESDQEFGFGKWNNNTGKEWVQSVFSAVKKNVILS